MNHKWRTIKKLAADPGLQREFDLERSFDEDAKFPATWFYGSFYSKMDITDWYYDCEIYGALGLTHTQFNAKKEAVVRALSKHPY